MTLNYKVKEFMGEEFISLEKDGILYSIPKDPANSDYQRYLRWLENPNEEDNGGLN
jgi:hypothetical protein